MAPLEYFKFMDTVTNLSVQYTNATIRIGILLRMRVRRASLCDYYLKYRTARKLLFVHGVRFAALLGMGRGLKILGQNCFG